MLTLTDLPLSPDPDQARRWLTSELSHPEYEAARPNWFDQLAQSFWDWVMSLGPTGSGGSGVILAVALVIVAAVVVAVFVVFGVPRLSTRRRTLAVRAADDTRSAAQMRRDARNAAAERDWSLAVIEAFRALAVGLDERTLVSLTQGMTAQSIAHQAADSLPAHADELNRAAHTFDSVRYLGRPASEDDYDALRRLDEQLLATAHLDAARVVGAR